MPRLRRLDGYEVIRILETFGFVVIRIRGSHHILRRTVRDETQTLNIPVHGHDPLKTGMLHATFRDACRYIAEEDLKPHFFTIS
jgi:predicted RNA binding protein YcfA (HicA-like mRNA interferase family)